MPVNLLPSGAKGSKPLPSVRSDMLLYREMITSRHNNVNKITLGVLSGEVGLAAAKC